MLKRKFKRMLALAVCGVIAVSAVTGCSKKETKANDKSDVVSVTIGNWPMRETNQSGYETYEKLRKDMKERYPNIEIIPSEFEYAINTFLPMAASGQLPNMFNVAFTEPSKLIDAGYVKDITDVVKKIGYDTAINPKVMDIVSRDGRIYGIPTVGYTMALNYNMGLMRQAGLVNDDGSPKTPKTYEELAQMAKEIKDKTGKAGFEFLTMETTGGWVFMNIAWSYGVDFMEKVDGKWKATFNTPEAVEAMNYVRDLKWKYDCLTDDLFVDQPKGAKLIATRQAAMGFNDPEFFAIPMTKEYKLDLDELAFSSLPGGPKGRYAQFGGSAVMFSKETTDEQVEACIKWLEVIGSGKEFTDEMKKGLETSLSANAADKLPVFHSAFKFWVDDERGNAESEIYDKYVNVNPALYRDTTEGVELRVEEPVEAQHLYEILSSVIQEVLMNENADVEKLLEEANNKFQRDFLDKAQ